MHPYLTAVHRACCAVLHNITTARVITAPKCSNSECYCCRATKQTPIAFLLNPNTTRPLSSAGPLFIVHLRCHYSNSPSPSTSAQSQFPLTTTGIRRAPSFQKPLKRIFVARPLVLFRLGPLPARALALGHRPRTRIREASQSRQRTLSLLSRRQDTGGGRGGAERTSSNRQTPLVDLTSLFLPPSLLHTQTPPPPPPNTRHSLPPSTLAVAQAPSRPRYYPLTSLYHRARFVVRVSHDPATTERDALDTASAVAPQSAPLSCNPLEGTSPIRAPRPADYTLATSYSHTNRGAFSESNPAGSPVVIHPPAS